MPLLAVIWPRLSACFGLWVECLQFDPMASCYCLLICACILNERILWSSIYALWCLCFVLWFCWLLLFWFVVATWRLLDELSLSFWLIVAWYVTSFDLLILIIIGPSGPGGRWLTNKKPNFLQLPCLISSWSDLIWRRTKHESSLFCMLFDVVMTVYSDLAWFGSRFLGFLWGPLYVVKIMTFPFGVHSLSLNSPSWSDWCHDCNGGLHSYWFGQCGM